MATIFLPRIASPDSKDRNVPRIMTSSHSPSFKTTVPSDRDNDDDGIKTEVKTETVWETMNPYTETEPSTSAVTSRPRTKIAATPVTTTTITTKNEANYSTASPTATQSPESLAPEFRESGGLSDGAIAAVVLGVVFGLAVIALAAWFLFYKRHRGSTINRATSPQTPIYKPPPPSSPLPTPPPVAELSSQGDGSPSMEDSWISYGDRVRSPTPQTAVAEVKSFTRTRQKPRVYTVGGGRIAELHGSEPSTGNDDGDDEMSPISPMSRAGPSLADRRVVSPMSLTLRFSTLSSRADPNSEKEENPRRGF
ncbi:hypothetical protein NW768_003832 [Fusarium equiseti]|uniref:Uncharacterized protein n=1 Tax=Fusarium equiseti TaxID=61235 RepID=A0ABQ8RIR5_FUSEQ|nr:hypothetical protein NW768_003832 [Fusarium equiseti]